MKMHKRLIGVLVTSLVVLGLVFGSAGTAFAATSQVDEEPTENGFALLGALASKAAIAEQPLLETWMVNEQAFIVTSAPVEPPAEGEADIADPTVCTDMVGEVIACADVAVGDVISVSGEKVPATATTPETWYAATIAVVSEAVEGQDFYTYPGELKAINEADVLVDALTFTTDDMTLMPDFIAVGDTVLVTYTILEGGAFYATSIEVLEQAAPYTHTGIIEGIVDNGDGTFTWTVGGVPFLVNGETALPPYYGLGDEVTVTFMVVGDDNVALSVEVVSTFIPPKTETERCLNRLKDHPAIVKLAAEVGEPDHTKLMEFFCMGFGVGEIKLAYRYAEGSAYSPEMLLALRSSGMGWGDIKKLAAGMPADDDDDDDMDDDQNDKHGKPENPGKPETPGKPENPGNSGNPGKPENPGYSNNDDDTEGPGNSDHAKDNPGKAKGKNK
jgi:hypothetical protein